MTRPVIYFKHLKLLKEVIGYKLIRRTNQISVEGHLYLTNTVLEGKIPVFVINGWISFFSRRDK
jgi:hypothetical protein